VTNNVDKIIHSTRELPVSPLYSQAVEGGGLIFLSGAGPVNAVTNTLEIGDIKKSTEVALSNIQKVLKCAGSSLDQVMKVTIYLKDMNDFKNMNEVYATFFTDNPPARTCVAVKELPFNFNIEIEVIAIKRK
jgi:2-iminobutanoate/2-iminopropanoate deaminase